MKEAAIGADGRSGPAPSTGAFTLLQLVDGRLIAGHSVNRAADHMMARRLIADGTQIDVGAAADAATPLAKAVLTEASGSRIAAAGA